MANFTASNVMDEAAALLNDVSKAIFTYTAQLPYLKLAYRDMDQEFTANEIETNLISEAVISVPAGSSALPLPSSFFLPISLMEKGTGEANDKYVVMEEKRNINDMNMLATSTLGIWDFRHDCINLVASTADRTVRLYYWRTLPVIVDENSFAEIKGGQSYLSFRTAALCAMFIGGNANRASALNSEAEIAINRLIGLMVKNSQGNRTRRKAFRIRNYLR